MTAGKATYELSSLGSADISMAKPLRVLQAYNLDSSNVRRPLMIISRDEYTRLGQVTTQGAVNSIFVDKQAQALKITTWLVPDTTAATGTLHLILQYQVTNFINLTETLEFPQEWLMALRWGLADDICTGQPQAIMDRCAMRAKAYREALEDWDVEDASTFFSPGTRGRSSHFGG
jgi:hypothetical protein